MQVHEHTAATRMQVRGQAMGIYKAEENFYESQNAVHPLAANASGTEPAKFIAFFVCDHDAPLSTPAPGEPK